MKKLVLIDGKSVLYRGYYAMKGLAMPDGTPIGGVYGFASILLEILSKIEPDYVAVAWDKSKTNIRRRRELYPEYKAGRKPAPPDFYEQIPYLMELLESFHIPLYEADDYEADDIIGTLSQQANAQNVETIIISSDLDMLQIVDHDTKLYALKTGFSNVAEYDIPTLERKHGIKKDQFLDLKALKGDSSDNIPGVPGIGEKGAIKLLQEYQTLDNIYAHIDEITGSLNAKLKAGKDSAYLSKKLGEIYCDAPVGFVPEEADISKANGAQILQNLEKLRFKSLVKKAQEVYDIKDVSSEPQLESEENIESLEEDIFLSYNVKSSMHADSALAQDILIGKTKYWDLGQARVVLNESKNDHQATLFDDRRADIKEYRRQKLAFDKQPKLKNVFEQLDQPLIPILYQMEQAGIKIDRAYFAQMSTEFKAELAAIEKDIYELSGATFNVNSPIQVGQILFDKLNLPTAGIKKTQKGYSTGAKELEKLRAKHPIIEKLERHREVAKLISTYIDPLPSLADQNGRIHTTFTQDVTATGRLSSINPNLQNIPTRTDEGKRIRTGFVADDGKVLISADYSQFELRLAAIMSGDTELIEDFNNNIDIHTKTASDVFGVPMDKVTSSQRRAAKTINFGVLYGMSARGLSQATDMSQYEAKTFIDKYFAVRQPIRDYLDNILAGARQNGYVETYFGRRRLTPDVNSPNFLVRSSAERAAANMPIQGTEADLMKRAMIEVSAWLKNNSSARMILQVHDSLILECDQAAATNVAQKLEQIMENIAPEFAIKLAVDVSIGKNWGEL